MYPSWRQLAPLCWLLCSCHLHSKPFSSQQPHDLYGRGLMELLHDDDRSSQSAAFTTLRNQFPYSRFTTLAELRLADHAYRQRRFPEALEMYRAFLRFHPNHTDAAYAAFRAAMCSYAQIPTDFLLVPPSYEKDQVHTRLAIEAFQSFLQQYPKGHLSEQARSTLLTCQDKLAQHELYVAKFYLQRREYNAAYLRAVGLIEQFPHVPSLVPAYLIAIAAKESTNELEEVMSLRQQLCQLPDPKQEAQKACLAMPQLTPTGTGTKPEQTE